MNEGIEKDLVELKEELQRLDIRTMAVSKAIEILEEEKIKRDDFNHVGHILDIVRRDRGEKGSVLFDKVNKTNKINDTMRL